MKKEREKKTAALMCFSENGYHQAVRAAEAFQQHGWSTKISWKSSYAAADAAWKGSLQEWTEVNFSSCGALVFVGASGIAVRAIAPSVRDKRSDPAVLVIDEAGTYVIPLLSGHLGGANELANVLAAEIGAIPVITTATDVHQKFSVDTFAKRNGLWISDMKLAKEVSAAILQGEPVKVTADPELEEQLVGVRLPQELLFVRRQENAGGILEDANREKGNPGAVRIHIGIRQGEGISGRILYLVPRVVTIGIGCKKNTSCEAIRDHVMRMLSENHIFPQAVCAAASIDIKKGEPGLLQFVREQGWKFLTFSAEELAEAPGSYSASSFVKSVTGVDNVCERSAVLASLSGGEGGGNFSAEVDRSEKSAELSRPGNLPEDGVPADPFQRVPEGKVLIVPKTGGNGVTAACARKDFTLSF